MRVLVVALFVFIFSVPVQAQPISLPDSATCACLQLKAVVQQVKYLNKRIDILGEKIDALMKLDASIQKLDAGMQKRHAEMTATYETVTTKSILPLLMQKYMELDDDIKIADAYKMATRFMKQTKQLDGN